MIYVSVMESSCYVTDNLLVVSRTTWMFNVFHWDKSKLIWDCYCEKCDYFILQKNLQQVSKVLLQKAIRKKHDLLGILCRQ